MKKKKIFGKHLFSFLGMIVWKFTALKREEKKPNFFFNSHDEKVNKTITQK